jgi:hypothetical protein
VKCNMQLARVLARLFLVQGFAPRPTQTGIHTDLWTTCLTGCHKSQQKALRTCCKHRSLLLAALHVLFQIGDSRAPPCIADYVGRYIWLEAVKALPCKRCQQDLWVSLCEHSRRRSSLPNSQFVHVVAYVGILGMPITGRWHFFRWASLSLFNWRASCDVGSAQMIPFSAA